MTITLHEQRIETLHDQVVSLIAQRWAKVFVCQVTIRTGIDHAPWTDHDQPCDIVGWYVSSGGNTMEWMAEVETEESLSDGQAADRWKKALTRGIPFYLLVPRGLKEPVQRVTEAALIRVSYIYEFTFINGVCHIL